MVVIMVAALVAVSFAVTLESSSSHSLPVAPSGPVVVLATEMHASPAHVLHARVDSPTDPATAPPLTSTVNPSQPNPSAVNPFPPKGLVADPGVDGQFVWSTVSGALSGLTGRVLVWLPRSYAMPGSATQRYPVIEVFHGVPGSPQNYVDLHLGHLMAAEAAARHVKEAILVIPDYTPRRLDTECVNGGTGKPAMEDWLTRDVPAWAQLTLRVQPQRTAWSTMGFSAGGWCAAMATMLHPDVYGSAIALGAYFQPDFDPSYRPFAPGSAAWDRYNLVKLAATRPPPASLWVETSAEDPLSYPTSSRLLAAARPPLNVTTHVLARGGHSMSVWLGLIPATFQWLGSTSPGFEP